MSQDLNELHWATLKKMVEDNGGAYESKEQAIAFLSALQPATDATPPTDPAVDADTTEGENAAADEVAFDVLDRKRPFGQVFGEVEGFPGARFLQDGHYFNAAGNKIAQG